MAHPLARGWERPAPDDEGTFSGVEVQQGQVRGSFFHEGIEVVRVDLDHAVDVRRVRGKRLVVKVVQTGSYVKGYVSMQSTTIICSCGRTVVDGVRRVVDIHSLLLAGTKATLGESGVIVVIIVGRPAVDGHVSTMTPHGRIVPVQHS